MQDVIGCHFMCPDCRRPMATTDAQIREEVLFLVGECQHCHQSISFSTVKIIESLRDFEMMSQAAMVIH